MASPISAALAFLATHACEKRIMPTTAKEFYEDHIIWRKEIQWDGQTITSDFLNNVHGTLSTHVQVMQDAVPLLTTSDPGVTTGFRLLATFATRLCEHYGRASRDDLATYKMAEEKWNILFQDLWCAHKRKLVMMGGRSIGGLEVVQDALAGRMNEKEVVQVATPPDVEGREVDPMNAKEDENAQRAREIREVEAAMETSSLRETRAPGDSESIDDILRLRKVFCNEARQKHDANDD